MGYLVVKNTFLELVPTVEAEMRSRNRSCPIALRRSTCTPEQKPPTELLRIRSDQLNLGVDAELPNPFLGQCCAKGREAFQKVAFASYDPGEVSCADEAPSDKHDQVGTLQKKGRPCKEKRVRYKNFVHRLQKQVLANPLSFSMDEVEYPPSLQINHDRRSKLIKRIESYQHEVLMSFSDQPTSVTSAPSSSSCSPLLLANLV